MFRAQRRRQPARSAGRDPEGSRRCSSISTTARTSRSIPTRTSAASCSSCSRWAWATTPSATCARPRAHSPAGRTTCSTFKFDADQHDFGEKTFLGQTGTVQRRRHHRHHPQAAGHRRVRVREAVPILRARGGRAVGQSGAGPHVPRQRLPDEAAAEADLPLQGFLQRRRRTRRRSRVPCSSSSRPTRSSACARCRRFPTSAA